MCDRDRGPCQQHVNPLAGAYNLEALRLRISAQAGGETYRAGSEALATALAVHPHAVSSARRK